MLIFFNFVIFTNRDTDRVSRTRHLQLTIGRIVHNNHYNDIYTHTHPYIYIKRYLLKTGYFRIYISLDETIFTSSLIYFCPTELRGKGVNDIYERLEWEKLTGVLTRSLGVPRGIVGDDITQDPESDRSVRTSLTRTQYLTRPSTTTLKKKKETEGHRNPSF